MMETSHFPLFDMIKTNRSSLLSGYYRSLKFESHAKGKFLFDINFCGSQFVWSFFWLWF